MPINNTANKVLKATFWYAFSDFLLKGLAFITTPIFSRILTKAEYGIFANYSTWYTLLATVITLHLRVSLTRARFDFEKDLNSFITSILILGSVATFLSGIIIFINNDFFSNLFSLDKKYILMMCAMAFVSPAYDMFLAMQRFYYKYKLVAIMTVIVSLTSIGLSLLLILTMKDHLLARIIGSVAPQFLVSTVLYVYYLLKCGEIQTKYWAYSLPVAVPYIFHALSGNVLAQSDRVMITSICGATMTAINSVFYVREKVRC